MKYISWIILSMLFVCVFTGCKKSDMLRKMPKPKNNETVLKTKPDVTKIQALYLWEKGNVPAVTE